MRTRPVAPLRRLAGGVARFRLVTRGEGATRARRAAIGPGLAEGGFGSAPPAFLGLALTAADGRKGTPPGFGERRVRLRSLERWLVGVAVGCRVFCSGPGARVVWGVKF